MEDIKSSFLTKINNFFSMFKYVCNPKDYDDIFFKFKLFYKMRWDKNLIFWKKARIYWIKTQKRVRW